MNLFELGLLLVMVVGEFASVSCYCSKDQTPSKASQSILKVFCKLGNGTLVNRECKLVNNDTIGLDLSSCGNEKNSVGELDDHVKSKLEWLAINNNTYNFSKSISYLRSSKIKHVVINIEDDCDDVFKHTTTESGLRICSGPLNACKVKKDSCPEHSECSADGPGLFACDCIEDWKSYKCLKKKGFPMNKWLISICVATVVFIIMIRLLQHKDLKKGAEFKKLSKLSNTDFANPESNPGLFD